MQGNVLNLVITSPNMRLFRYNSLVTILNAGIAQFNLMIAFIDLRIA